MATEPKASGLSSGHWGDLSLLVHPSSVHWEPLVYFPKLLAGCPVPALSLNREMSLKLTMSGPEFNPYFLILGSHMAMDKAVKHPCKQSRMREDFFKLFSKL